MRVALNLSRLKASNSTQTDVWDWDLWGSVLVPVYWLQDSPWTPFDELSNLCHCVKTSCGIVRHDNFMSLGIFDAYVALKTNPDI